MNPVPVNIRFVQTFPKRDPLATHLTMRGRGVAVVQSVEEFETADDERAFMRAVIKGLSDVEEGREDSLEEARSRLGLNESCRQRFDQDLFTLM